MSNLHFGTDIRIENLMMLEAISAEDAEVISEDLCELATVFADVGVVMPEEELCDGWELREFFEEEGVSGFFGFACTTAIETAECGECIDYQSWSYYVRIPIYGKDISEFKKKAIEEVAAYRKKKIGNQGGEA